MARAEFSFIATWNRTLQFVEGTYVPDLLADVDLVLSDATGAVIQESRSPVDNIEHIYFRDLAAGDYSLQLTSDQAASVGVGFRLDLSHCPALVPMPRPGVTLALDGLVVGVTYAVERRVDDGEWETAQEIFSLQSQADWSDPTPPAAGRVLYRLRYFNP